MADLEFIIQQVRDEIRVDLTGKGKSSISGVGRLCGVDQMEACFYARKDLLPACSGIYFLFSDQELLYIGISKNIQNRWRSHHVNLDGQDLSLLNIHYLCMDIESAVALEPQLILELQPPLNCHGKEEKPFGWVPLRERRKFLESIKEEAEREIIGVMSRMLLFWMGRGLPSLSEYRDTNLSCLRNETLQMLEYLDILATSPLIRLVVFGFHPHILDSDSWEGFDVDEAAKRLYSMDVRWQKLTETLVREYQGNKYSCDLTYYYDLN